VGKGGGEGQQEEIKKEYKKVKNKHFVFSNKLPTLRIRLINIKKADSCVRFLNLSETIFSGLCYLRHVLWAPCHNGMMRFQVADSEGGLQICRVEGNILNKLSGTANKGWYSRLGPRRWDNNYTP
jgi:hypothetical protein